MSKTDDLVERLQTAGFSSNFLAAAVPSWSAGEESASGQMILRLLLARRLNLDPEALMSDDAPLGFLQSGPVKFKHLRLAPGQRLDTLTGFALGVSRILFSISESVPLTPASSAAELRQAILDSGRDQVGFGDVLTLCWSLGIPVLHLRVFPAQTKGITAMAVRLGNRFAILVARESGVPAQYMFHVAHELGHIVLGHLHNVSAIVDADPLDPANAADELVDDDEERAADRFAQHLLTGNQSFSVTRDLVGGSTSGSADELARRALQLGADVHVDPGHVVMAFGYATGDWPLAMAAAKLLADQAHAPAFLVNKVFWAQFGNRSDDDAIAFLKAVASP